MSILFNRQKKIFKIDTKNSSYVFCVSDFAFLEHFYYGKRIQDEQIKYISNRQVYSFNSHESRESRAFSTATVCAEVAPFNNGDFRTPSLVYDYDNQTDCNRLRYHSHEIYKGRKPLIGLPYSRADENAETLEVILTDDGGMVELRRWFNYPTKNLIPI